MKKSKTLKWIFIVLGAILMVVLSFTLLYKLLIPDVCYYHTHEMNSFMSLFYSAGPEDNGHPAPNFTNFLISFVFGGILGYALYKLTTPLRKKF
ncbi:hypothetical protein [Flavobacterium orientale]|uniref:Uncharacterized protein n=1 Tax=Flavobacterium orientale TaxID=1756020 RepID=A0A916Y880_9FLAO|nr:hypothetical protein [Flavobacterium orientale]GGD33254.1 hypothetical protein GCM10011343_24120 [Flavobacterium orientale]